MNEIQEECLYILKEFDRICSKHKIDYVLSCGTLLGAIRHEGFIPWDDDLDVAMTREEYERFLSLAPSELGKDFFLQNSKTEKYYFNSFTKIRSNRAELIERPTQYTDINQGVWIDVFPMDKIPDDQEMQKNQFEKIKKLDKKIRFWAYIYPNDSDNGLKRSVKTIIQRVNNFLMPLNFLLPRYCEQRESIITEYNNIKSSQFNMLSFPLTDELYDGHVLLNSELENLVLKQFEDSKFLCPKDYDVALTRMFGDYMKKPPIEEQISGHGMLFRKRDSNE